MHRCTCGSPAVQSYSGTMLSYSGMVKKVVSGKGLTLNSLTICFETSLYEAFGLLPRISNARRKISDTVVRSLIIIKHRLSQINEDFNPRRPNRSLPTLILIIRI